MKDQKLIVSYAVRINGKIDPLLSDGWRIVSVSCENVASGTGADRGYIIIVLEK